MQLMRIAWRLGLPLLLGISSFAAGCGPGGEEGPAPHTKEFGQTVKEGNRKFHQQLKTSAKGNSSGRGKARTTPGQ
jgi:hypothetical protein